MRRLADRDPRADGVKRTLIVQLAFEASAVPQVLVCEKFPAFVPVIVIPVIVSDPGPTLVIVMVDARLVVLTVWEPNEMLLALRLTMVPVPVSATLCGLFVALLVTVREAVRAPG